MPNAVKYKTGNLTGSLQKGNVALGVSGSLGPTSTTGWYNGPNPPTSGLYQIIETAASGDPDVYCPQNDAELIKFARWKGATGANTGSAAAVLAWIGTQTNLMAANFQYENIVTDGLVLNLDAGFVGSYPTINTTWYDLSGNSNNSTLTNGPTYDTAVSGNIVFDGIDDQCPFYAPNLGTTTTVEMWTKCISLGGKMFFGWLYYDVWTQGDTIGYNTGNSDIFGMSNSLVSSLGIVGNWKHLVFEMRSDVPYTNNKIYVNSINQSLSQQYSSENSGTRNFNNGNGTICGWLGGGYYMNQQVSTFRVYNRALTQAEITQNYNAQKGRFGL